MMNNLKFNIDTVTVVLYVTKLWALSAWYASRAFEFLFMCMMGMPESILKMLAGLTPVIKNSHGENIKIIRANNGRTNITEKFKLFLAFYWTQGDEFGCLSAANFDFAKFKKLLNTSLLYCCYLLHDDNGVDPDKFVSQIHRLFVEMKTDECRQVSDDIFTLRPLRDINFDANKAAADSFDADQIAQLVASTNQ